MAFLNMDLAVSLLLVAAPASSFDAGIDEEFIYAHADLVCADDATTIGFDTAGHTVWQKDVNKDEGWELSTLKWVESESCTSCFAAEGVFILSLPSLPAPVSVFTWTTVRLGEERDLVLDYRFGLDKPQGERLGIPCKKTR